MSSSRTEVLVDVTMPQMGVSVAEGTIVGVAGRGRRPDRGRRDDLRDLDRQDRHRGAVAGVRRGGRDPGPDRRDGGRRDGAGADRAGGGGGAPRASVVRPRSMATPGGAPEARPLDGEPGGCPDHRNSISQNRPGPGTGTGAIHRSSSASPPSTGSTCRRSRARGATAACASRMCCALGRHRRTSRRCTSRARTGPIRSRRPRPRRRRWATAASCRACAGRSAST